MTIKQLNDIETQLWVEGSELSRRLLQEYLDGCGKGDVGESIMLNRKVQLSRKRLSSRKIHTVFGTINLTRMGYSRPGFEACFPLDAQLNLPRSSYSYPLQKILAKEASKGSLDDAIELVRDISGVKISKGTAIRLVMESAESFESFYNKGKGEVFPSRVDQLLVLTTEGKGIVMRPEDLREQTRKKRESSDTKYKSRLSKGKKRNSKRMAQVASFYDIARYKRDAKDVIKASLGTTELGKRPKPEEKRVWASVEKSSV